MKLYQKFYKAINLFSVNISRAEECERLADEYAIDFAEWVIKGNVSILQRYPKESLEIYKEENKL